MCVFSCMSYYPILKLYQQQERCLSLRLRNFFLAIIKFCISRPMHMNALLFEDLPLASIIFLTQLEKYRIQKSNKVNQK